MIAKLPGVVQRSAVGLVLVAFAILAPSGLADGGGDDSCRSHPVATVIGTNSAGEVRLCIRYPDRVATSDDRFRLTATGTSPALQGSNPSLTLTLNGLSGCTIS